MALNFSSLSGGTSFTVVTSTGGSKTATLDKSYPAGTYLIESKALDTNLEVYLGASDGTPVGSAVAGAKTVTASASFLYVTTVNADANDAVIFTLKSASTLSTKTDATWAPPTITDITPSGLPNINNTTTITGTNFASNVEVKFRKSDDSTLVTPKTTVRGSATSIIATRPDSFSPTDAPYDVIVTNATTGLSGTSLNSITAGSATVWSTSATLPAFQKTIAYSQAVVATDADTSPTVTYSQVSATLPTGITFNTSTATFSGTPSANGGSYSAVIRATDLGGNFADRTFTLAQDKPDAPGIGVATATGASTATIAFTAPAYTGTSTITSYTATSSPAGGTGSISQSGSGTITVTGLSQSTEYTFTVTATNSSGNSLASGASSSVTTSNSNATINYLVVAGGGGGGSGLGSAYYSSSGGGAGGFRTSFGTSGRNSNAESTLSFAPSIVYTVQVGAGGTWGIKGQDSYISGSNITTVTSIGGGCGSPPQGGDYAPSATSPMNGGSGGGGGDAVGTGTSTGGTGTANQGYEGGNSNGSRGFSAGGGGAGAAGSSYVPGNGIQSSISGSTLYYAGGGGGVNGENGAVGSGGLGGGASGSNYGTGANASANTGGGGGGAGYPGSSFYQRGSSGGSGIVIIRSSLAAVSTSGSPEYTNPSTGVHIYKFNATGTITL